MRARDTPWFADLTHGSGAADGLPRTLRQALAVITVDAAREAATRARAKAEQQATTERARARQQRDRVEQLAKQQEQELAAAKLQADVQRAARRRSKDAAVLVVAVVASATVLLPWLLGRFVLRDTPIHPWVQGVYDTAARGNGPYFLADWLGGVAVLVTLAAAIVVAGRWHRRASTLVPALLLGVLALAFVLPASRDHWRTAESDTVTRLATTAYPFSEHWATCGGQSFMITEGTTTRAVQVYTAVAQGAPGCNRLVVYDGWHEIGQATLPSGEQFTADGGLFGGSWDVWPVQGTSAQDTGVVTTTATGDLVGLVLASPNQLWRAPTAGASLNFHEAGLFLATFGEGQPGSRVDALQPLTGQVLWTATCPAPDQVISSPAHEDNATSVSLSCKGPGGLGDTGQRNYTLGLDGAFLG